MFASMLSVALLAFAIAVTRMPGMLYLTSLGIVCVYQSGIISCVPGDKTLGRCSIEALIDIAKHAQKAGKRQDISRFHNYSLLDLMLALGQELSQQGLREKHVQKKPCKRLSLHTSGWSFGT